MSLLLCANGPDAVKNYRFYRARFDTVEPPHPPGQAMIRWLADQGLEGWDGYWTNNYMDESQAVAQSLGEFGIPLIAEVDDFFEGVPKGNQAFVSWWHRKKIMYRALLEMADRRVCSTPWLAEQYGGEVAPNFVREDEWDWDKRADNGKVTLLHCGSVNRAEDYLQKEGAFRAFLKQPDTQIVFMGWLPKWADDYENGKVGFCRWTNYDQYNRMLMWLNPDITVSPMEHNEFNLAKSNIKWLEAGVMGTCFVGERWGEYLRTVGDGGVLADSDSEWEDVLVDLAQDHGKRREIAAKGREMVLKDWTWPAVKGQWEKAVLGVHDGTGIERVAGRREQHSAAAG